MKSKPTYQELEDKISDLEKFIDQKLKKQNNELTKAKEKAEENEQRFKALHNATFGGIAIHNNGIILDCNLGLSKITGYDFSELINMDGLLLIAEKSRAEVRQNIRTAYEKPYKVTGVKKNGTEYSLRIEARMILYKGEKVRVVEFRDITKEIEKDKKIEKLSIAVEQSANTVIIADTNGNIEYVNPKFSELSGYTKEEILGKNPRILNSGIHSKEYYINLWETITAGKIWQGEFCNKNKQGELYWEHATITPITNKQNEITGYIAIKECITDKKESEAKIKKQKEKIDASEFILTTLINATPDTIYFKDGKGRWLKSNKAGLELFDLLNKNYTNKTDRELAEMSPFYKDALLYCEKTDEMVWQKGIISNIEETILKPDGNSEIYDVVKIPLFNNDNSRKGLVIIGRNITKRKQIEFELKKQNKELIIAKEKAEESNQLKTEFIHNMSHEIRTPMNGILGFSSILNKPNLSNENRKKYISIIQSSGNQLMRIIDDILEISKLRTKQVKIIEKQICLNNLFTELFSIFNIKAKKQGISFYLKKGLSDEESTILTDEAKLNTILSNLLENAFKFTAKGFIEFGYQLANNEFKIYIKDTGIGIKPESQKMIFARFSQEEKTLSRNVGGLGLGLSIVKENVELLGGKITVQSEKGKGATFFVTIPYKPIKNIEKPASKNGKKKHT